MFKKRKQLVQRFGNDQEKEGEGYIQVFDLGDCHSLK